MSPLATRLLGTLGSALLASAVVIHLGRIEERVHPDDIESIRTRYLYAHAVALWGCWWAWKPRETQT